MTRACDLIEMNVPAKAEYVGVIRLTASGIASRLDYTYEAIEDIKIAVTEACTNVVDHAYEDAGMIYLGFFIYSDYIEIVISDQGLSFDWKGMQSKLGPIDPNKPIAELKEGGLGLYLIKTLMDKVEVYAENGVVLKMTKFLEKDGVERYAEETSTSATIQK